MVLLMILLSGVRMLFFFLLNVLKTKEMTIDFSSRRESIQDKQICNGAGIQSVEQYKHLGTVLDNKLTFSPNTDALC